MLIDKIYITPSDDNNSLNDFLRVFLAMLIMSMRILSDTCTVMRFCPRYCIATMWNITARK